MFLKIHAMQLQNRYIVQSISTFWYCELVVATKATGVHWVDLLSSRQHLALLSSVYDVA